MVVAASVAIAAIVGWVSFGDARTEQQRCASHADAAHETGGKYPYCVNGQPSATLPR